MARLWLLERLEADQIAERLGKEPNAVYQARSSHHAASEGVARVVMATPEQLLDELVDRWARGAPLDVDELLVRAGPRSDELADLIDAFLQRAPRREPTPEALAFVRSLDEPSLLLARQERRLKLDDLVAGLVERLGLPAGASAKVRRYYQQLELGQLDPAGVAASVWVALAGLLGRDPRGLAGMLPPAPALAPMYRQATTASRCSRRPRSTADRDEAPAAPEPDEVDRLFGVDPSD